MATITTSTGSKILSFVEKILGYAPELIEEVEAIVAKAKTSKTSAAIEAAGAAATLAGELSPANATTASDAAGAVETGIQLVETVVNDASTKPAAPVAQLAAEPSTDPIDLALADKTSA